MDHPTMRKTGKTSSILLPADKAAPLFVPAGEDRFGEHKNLGVSSIAVKISKQETSEIFAVEITLQQKGGPEKHLHYNQDEWFYALEGDLLIEAGDQQYHMKPGDSLFVKRRVPHVWANVGESRMRFVATLTPAGKLEDFFLEAAKKKTIPGPDPEFWRRYDLEWVGPPLKVK